MPTIFIDNKPYQVTPGQNLLHAAVSEGLDLPYFCWHPALGSAGACRQCAVQHFKDENDKDGRMVMSCMTPTSEGARFSIDHPTCKSFRANIIEWMMTNHPHDCPVCDEGGECHLQNMTIMSGHNKRRYRFKKRTFKNQNLGPFIHHEMNRCITCYRCVRYYRDVAGGEDLHAFSSSNHVYFGRFEDGQLENEFSGNLVEVCPTGVFTDKTFRANYVRQWDLQTAPSVCQLCSLGCNINPGARLGNLRRVQNRFHPDINGYFLCDRGRFGHRFVNDAALVHVSDFIQPLAANSLRVGIGSPRASLEANFALRTLVGEENFYDGHSNSDSQALSKIMAILRQYPETASLKDVREADCLLILDQDLYQTAPMLALSVRQNLYERAQKQAALKGIPAWNDLAVRNTERDIPDCVYIASDKSSKLDGLAFQKTSLDLQAIRCWLPRLQAAENPVVITGTSSTEAMLDLSLEWRALLPHVKLCFVLPESNSFGLALMQAKPLSTLPSALSEAIILENSLPEELRERCSKIIAIDFLESELSKQANVAFGCASFAESTGSLVNNEGRAQRYYSVFERSQKRPESWRILQDLGGVAWKNLDALCADLAKSLPVFEPFFSQLPSADFRIHGQKIARQSADFSGRTAISATISMHEQPPKPDFDSPFVYSMEGSHERLLPGSSGVKLKPL